MKEDDGVGVEPGRRKTLRLDVLAGVQRKVDHSTLQIRQINFGQVIQDADATAPGTSLRDSLSLIYLRSAYAQILDEGILKTAIGFI